MTRDAAEGGCIGGIDAPSFAYVEGDAVDVVGWSTTSLARGRVYQHSSYAHIVDHPGRVSARIHGSSEVHHPRWRPFWSLRVRLNLNLRSSALLNELDVFAGSTDDHANLGVRNRHRRRRRRESRPGGRAFTSLRTSVKLGRRLVVPRVDVLGELGAFLAKKRRYQLRPAHALKQRPDRALVVARAIVRIIDETMNH